MKLLVAASAKAGLVVGACALVFGLSACAGGGSSSSAAPVTQSNISLPSSVQVVSAN